MEVTFPDLCIDPATLVEMQCYRALRKIKHILEDETLADPDCFNKIEEIVNQLESFGSTGGLRHDFG